MSGVTVTKQAHPLIQVNQWVRNGKIVAAELQSRIAETIGHAAYSRPKLVFHRAAPISGAAGGANIPSSTSGTRTRWRFAWRSGPYARYVYVQMEMAPQNSGAAGDPYGLLEVSDGTGTVIGKSEAHWGNSDGTYTDVPRNFGGSIRQLVDPTTQDLTVVEIEPDTDYWGVFYDVNYGRIVAAQVWEFSLGADTDNGYPVNAHAVGSPVLVSHRETPAQMARTLWKKGGAHLINWCADTDATAPTTSSAQAGYENVISGSSSVSAASPGWTLDMRKRTTLSRAALGVPVVMKVTATSTAGNTATVRLVDSSGTTVLEQACDQAGEFNYVTAGYIPATLAKYDLHWGGTSDAFTLYSVNVYEYDAAGETITGEATVSFGALSVIATGTVA
jgi:hypothetical protein